jgi:hypothetical protein
MTPEDIRVFIEREFSVLESRRRSNPNGWSFFYGKGRHGNRIIRVTKAGSNSPTQLLLSISDRLKKSPNQIRDFRGGQDALRSHISRELDLYETLRGLKTTEDIQEILKRTIDTTTKERLVNARIGQGEFRAEVLELWDDRCAVTGSCTLQAIRASHIKPWRSSTHQERLDPRNGLALVGTLDALFDSGLISFDSRGEMSISSRLGKEERRMLGLDGSSQSKSLRKRPRPKTAKYLAWHFKNCFKD